MPAADEEGELGGGVAGGEEKGKGVVHVAQ